MIISGIKKGAISAKVKILKTMKKLYGLYKTEV